MASSLSSNQATGIILIVLGALALAGWFNAVVILAAGAILLVYGILVLMGKAKSSQLVGIICVVAGIVLLVGNIPGLGTLIHLLTVVVGIILIVVGVLKLMDRM